MRPRTLDEGFGDPGVPPALRAGAPAEEEQRSERIRSIRKRAAQKLNPEIGRMGAEDPARASSAAPQGKLCFAYMAAVPPPNPQTRFSPDGFWWWDGAEWRPAVSPDRLWRWSGQAWVPALPGAPKGTGFGAVAVAVAIFGGILLLTVMVTVVVLLTMGNQIANVFSNVAAALSGS